MATFSRTLEAHAAAGAVSRKRARHEYVTLEHLLLSLIDDDDAAQVMHACKVDLDKLETQSQVLSSTELDSLVVPNREHEEPRPTAGFQRVLQRSMLHVDFSGGREVTGANVLVALFSERESHAAYFLQEQDMTRYDAVNFIAHGLPSAQGRPNRARCAAPARKRRRARGEAGLGSLGRVLREPQQEGQGRQNRSVDRTRAGSVARDPDPLPPAKEQSAAGRRPRRRQDRDRRRPRAQDQSKSRCRKFWPTPRFSHSIWARCWRARAIAAISKSA